MSKGEKETEYYFRILRNRIIECICRGASRDNMKTFHGVDMVERCARGFLDQQEADKYRYSGEDEYYKHVLQRVYKPLVKRGLLVENENNYYSIKGSRLRNMCRDELQSKEYIIWEEFERRARNESDG
jgi:hypothetical protein